MSDFQIKIELEGKILYKVKYKNNWSVVILPDNILLDDYHGKGGHIHPEPEKHKEIQYKIKTDDLETVYNIVHTHIEKNKGLNLKKLMNELIE
jgi:hypothetical protein